MDTGRGRRTGRFLAGLGRPVSTGKFRKSSRSTARGAFPRNIAIGSLHSRSNRRSFTAQSNTQKEFTIPAFARANYCGSAHHDLSLICLLNRLRARPCQRRFRFGPVIVRGVRTRRPLRKTESVPGTGPSPSCSAMPALNKTAFRQAAERHRKALRRFARHRVSAIGGDNA